MPFANYAELKQSVERYLHRGDLTGMIPDFIALVEAKLNRELRVAQMEARATANLTSAYIPFPVDYLSLRNIQINGDPITVLEYTSPEGLDRFHSDTPGIPRAYSIINNEIQIGPIPNATFPIEIVYYRKIPALSDETQTNWVLDSHPDVYLYGSLLEAQPYLRNDNRSVVWLEKIVAAVHSLKSADDRDRWSGVGLQVRHDLRGDI